MLLRRYMLTLRHGAKGRFAEQIGVGLSWLGQIAHDLKVPSPELAARISEATGGKVTELELLYPHRYTEEGE